MHSVSGTPQKLGLSQGALVEIKATAVVEWTKRTGRKMINEKVFKFLEGKGFADRIYEHKETIDTVVSEVWSAAHFCIA